MPIWIFAAPFVLAGEVAVAYGLWWAMLPAAVYGAVVPSRPQRGDGFEATAEYARNNGLRYPLAPYGPGRTVDD